MLGLFCFVLAALASPFKSKSQLEAENAVLRHQLIVLRRKVRGRVRLTKSDRWFLIQPYRWFPSILSVLTIIRPETLLRWHRAGFRCYWRWKCGSRLALRARSGQRAWYTGLSRLDTLTDLHEREYEFFSADSFPQLLAVHGVTLTAVPTP
jgi:hypothetical protein